MVDTSARVGALSFRNPFLLASGIWGESGESLAGAWRAGAGGVVTKSIGSEARPGYPNPTVEQYERWGFLNAMGLPNPGIGEYPKEIALARDAGVAIVGSVFGHDAEEFGRLAAQIAETGVLAVELNLSCPHAEGLGSEIGQDPELVSEVTRAVRRSVKIPVWVKITPNVAAPEEIAAAAERAGADAITAINTVRGLAIDAALQRPVLAHGLGGLSGPAIKPVGLACVWKVFERVKIPIVGVGGISSGTDAVEYLLAGASAVQVGTAVSFERVSVFGRLVEELTERMRVLGVSQISDLVGAAHRAARVGG
ncbi:MAG TPA: dihydroorotate dehydrogenase [Thermoplasmata archaeon]|nr:dihydroorotate dehydrogenase [Thermoplasmata archaeon]